MKNRKAKKNNSLCFEVSDVIINAKDQNAFQGRYVILFLNEASTRSDVISSVTPLPTMLINKINRDNLVQLSLFYMLKDALKRSRIWSIIFKESCPFHKCLFQNKSKSKGHVRSILLVGNIMTCEQLTSQVNVILFFINGIL